MTALAAAVDLALRAGLAAALLFAVAALVVVLLAWAASR